MFRGALSNENCVLSIKKHISLCVRLVNLAQELDSLGLIEGTAELGVELSIPSLKRG